MTQPAHTQHLQPWFAHCTACGRRLWPDYRNRRTIATLTGLLRLTLDIRRCHNPDCQRYRKPYRPEAEGCYALPQHEFGLDVIALVGNRRYRQHRSGTAAVGRSVRGDDAAWRVAGCLGGCGHALGTSPS